MVNKGLPNINPSAQSAHPEYEFKTVIATGISAAPIEKIIFHPKIVEVIDAINNAATLTGTDYVYIIAESKPIEIAASGLFKNSLYGKVKFLPLKRLASLMNAAIDPVKVTPPINVPKNEAIICKLSK